MKAMIKNVRIMKPTKTELPLSNDYLELQI